MRAEANPARTAAPSQSKLEEDLLAEALQLPPAEREAYLARRCEPGMVRRLMELLEGYQANSAFLETPAAAAALHATDAGFAPLAEPAPGDRVGRYQLIERLGEGGFGIVYLAEQQEPVRRHVALKLIRIGMDTREFIARFEAERQAMALMDHANIARVFDAGATEAGRPYLVMELVSGLPITRYCDEHRLTLRQRLELFTRVCRAIQHAHQKGVIHRDLKPSNILVAEADGAPSPKIIDFGIARALRGPLADATLATRVHALIGTPAYASPEHIDPGRDVDTRSDIYSAGVLLYELLTGCQPFAHESLAAATFEQMCRTIREVAPPRPSARVAALPPAERRAHAEPRAAEPARFASLLRHELDWIVMRCLDKDPKRRYETADALAADIERHLNHEPVLARPPSRTYRARTFTRRHWRGVIATAAVALSIVGGLIASSVLLMRARVAERAESALRRQAEEARFTEARRASRAVVDLAGERFAQGRTAEGLAHLASAGRQDPQNPAIAPRLASVLTARSFLLPQGILAEHPANVIGTEYTSDGSRLIAVWDDGTFARIDLGTGAVEKERVSTGKRSDHTLRSSQRFLLIYSPDGVIHTLHRETGKILNALRFASDPMGCNFVRNSTDLFVTKLTSNHMMVADAAAGRLIGEPIPYDGYLGAGPKWTAWSAENTAAPSRRIRFRRADADASEVTIEFPFPVSHRHEPLATSPDGRRVVTVEPHGDRGAFLLQLWSLPDGRPVAAPQRLARWGRTFYSPDGKFLLCWGDGLDVFDAETAERVARMPAAGTYVDETRYAFSPDSRTLVTWGNAGTVDVWDVESGVARVPPLRHGGNVGRVVFSRDGAVLLTISDGLIRIWRIATGELLAEPALALRGLPAVALSPDGMHIVVGADDGAIHRFRLGSGGAQAVRLMRPDGMAANFLPGSPARLLRMREDRAHVIDVASGRELAGGFAYPEPIRHATPRADGEVIVVQTRTGAWSAWWRTPEGPPRVVPIGDASTEHANAAFSPAGDLVVLSRANNSRAWHLRTGEPAGPPIATTVNAYHAQFANFHPDGRRLLLGSIQGQAHIWDVTTGRVLADFGSQPTNILLGLFSPDGARILSCGRRENATQLWHGETATPIGPPMRHPGLGSRGAFSPDSRLVALHASDGVVRILDARDSSPVQTLEADGVVRSVGFSPDNTRLVVGTNEGTAQVWNVQTGVAVTEPMRHGLLRVRVVEFSPDARFVRTETSDGSVHLWSVPPPLPAGAEVPAWLLELATLCAGKRRAQNGGFEAEHNTGDRLDALRRELERLPADAPYAEWGRWFFADPATRPVAPGFTLTPAQAKQL